MGVNTLRWSTVLFVGLAPFAGSADITLEPLFPAVVFAEPVSILQAPGDDQSWFVVEKKGRVRVLGEGRGPQGEVFIDIRDRIEARPYEAGLLGMAFHPDFPSNGVVFLSYTGPGDPLVSFLARFERRDGDRDLDPTSERVLLRVDQPFENHNGGGVGFGPDGYLYWALGDGGAAGDPLGNAQNRETLLGAILRIDVGEEPYRIPADNPLVGQPGRDELYAWGLRNPWRWSFDRATGTLWAGDVGQNRWEEIDQIVKGGNYGWDLREGSRCYEASTCPSAGLIDPVAEYSHDQGCSVTGGYVYRGSQLPALAGTYVYGDFCSGRIWGLPADLSGTPRQLAQTSLRIASFGQGHDGELYVVDFAGSVYRLVETLDR